MIMGIALTGFSCASYESFGKLPQEVELERIAQSSNWRDGEFRNLEGTELFAPDASRWKSLWEFFFADRGDTVPPMPVPVMKSDLTVLDPEQDVLVWLGHSTILMQLDGKKILIDPVFSSYAAPFSFVNRAFPAEYAYSADDMPPIDLLVISHDHYDHLDMATVKALQEKATMFLCPLGVGSHLRYWGIAPEKIHEADWNETFSAIPGLPIQVLPSRHFSGRGLTANRTLWAAFLFQGQTRQIFFSGDGGYGMHFSEIGKRFPGIDLALMEAGQYNADWPQIHMNPEDAVRAAQDLGAKRIIGIHYGRFALSRHAWDDPPKRLKKASDAVSLPLLTPTQGQVLQSDDF